MWSTVPCNGPNKAVDEDPANPQGTESHLGAVPAPHQAGRDTALNRPLPSFPPFTTASGRRAVWCTGLWSSIHPLVRKYLLSVQTHLNERLRRKIQNLAVVLSLSLLLWNLLLWTRSSWKGHAMGYGRASTQRFSEHLLCQAEGTETPGDRRGSASSLCPLSLSACQAHFHFIHFIQKWVWKQLLVHSGTR